MVFGLLRYSMVPISLKQAKSKASNNTKQNGSFHTKLWLHETYWSIGAHFFGFLLFKWLYRTIHLNHVFKVCNSLNPDYLTESFDHVSNIHKVSTRSSAHNYILQKVRGIASDTLSDKGIKIGTAYLNKWRVM